MALDDVTLAILAGGAGKRLGGVNKALIEIDGRTILDRLRILGAGYARTVLVVRDDAPWAPPSLERVIDRVPAKGAPGGLHAALAAAATPWVLLVACDMPFIRPAFIESLLAAREPSDHWVCVEAGGRLQPLPGLYHRALLPTLEALLPEDPSFRQILARAPGRRLEPGVFTQVDPTLESLRSLNTAADLEAAGAVVSTR